MSVEELLLMSQVAKWHNGHNTYARVEAAHIPVRYAASVDDVVRNHLLAPRARAVLIDPVGLEPVVVRDLGEGDLALDHVAQAPAGKNGVVIVSTNASVDVRAADTRSEISQISGLRMSSARGKACQQLHITVRR